MSYTVSILRRVQKELDDLPVQEAGRVISASMRWQKTRVRRVVQS